MPVDAGTAERGGQPVVDPQSGDRGQPEAVDCTLGQSGTVWLLAGATYLQSYSTAYRSCSVPARVYLFVPVIDAWADHLSRPASPPAPSPAKIAPAGPAADRHD